jgi:hypothetical protein
VCASWQNERNGTVTFFGVGEDAEQNLAFAVVVLVGPALVAVLAVLWCIGKWCWRSKRWSHRWQSFEKLQAVYRPAIDRLRDADVTAAPTKEHRQRKGAAFHDNYIAEHVRPVTLRLLNGDAIPMVKADWQQHDGGGGADGGFHAAVRTRLGLEQPVQLLLFGATVPPGTTARALFATCEGHGLGPEDPVVIDVVLLPVPGGAAALSP